MLVSRKGRLRVKTHRWRKHAHGLALVVPQAKRAAFAEANGHDRSADDQLLLVVAMWADLVAERSIIPLTAHVGRLSDPE